MAARRSSGILPIAVLLTIGIVVSTLTAYWQWQNKIRAEQQAEQAVAGREKALKAQAAAMSRLATLKLRLDRQSDIEFNQLLAAIDDDIRQFGSGVPNESYTELVRHLQSFVDTQRTELKQLTADKDRLQQDYLALEGIKQGAVEKALVAKQESEKDLLSERSDYLKKMARKDDQVAEIMDRAHTLALRLETEQRDKEKTREELLGQVNKLRTILMQMRAPHTPDALAKQKPDGRVIRSSAATKTAWLNIGSKDGARAGLTFSVQPSGFTGNPLTKPKAKIELVKVTGPDLSEARIVENSITNPIIEGDEIYNPAWNPGNVMRFALAGLMDMDGDGVDDRSKIKQIIIHAGAKIDAEILPDGTEQGAVTVETNFFIRGDRPNPEKGGPIQLRVLSAMAKMERTALDYGATVIDLSKFLDLMGYAPANRLHSSSAR